MADSKKSFRSLSIRLPLLFVSSALVIMVIVIPLVHYRFHSRMIDQYERMAEGITRLMANAIDGDKVEEYIERNFEMEEYRELHDYVTFSVIELPSMELLVLCPVRQLTGEQPQS